MANDDNDRFVTIPPPPCSPETALVAICLGWVLIVGTLCYAIL